LWRKGLWRFVVRGIAGRESAILAGRDMGIERKPLRVNDLRAEMPFWPAILADPLDLTAGPGFFGSFLTYMGVLQKS